MNDYIEEKNIPGLIIFTTVITIGLMVGVCNWQTYQINKKLDLILNDNYNDLKPIENDFQAPSGFDQLSQDAMIYYEEIGELVKATPTWLINGKKYRGFDYNNNIIPGFNISEGLKDVVLFSSPTCGFCQKAENWLNNNDIEFTKVCAPIHKGDYEICKGNPSFKS